MTRPPIAGLAALALTVAVADATPAAAATFGQPRVLSATSQVQGNASSLAVAVTADGRYAVLYTAASNLYPEPAAKGETRAGAILRFDLETPSAPPVVVAYNSSRFPSSQLIAASTQPSISADGRLVVFSTTQKLIATDGNGVEDVYVRDLAVPITDPAAYRLVSAVDGSETKPITYALAQGGSTATRNAISADGTKVVFTVNATSNVAGNNTPRRQVVLRDLTTNATTLVSRGTSGKPVGDQGRNSGLSPSPMISADGSTVIWNSAYIWGTTSVPGLLPLPAYLNTFNSNAVWRRVDGGTLGPVRLILTPADPEDPACTTVALTTSVVPGPCDSPIGLTTDDANTERVRPMALSADGRRVVIATGNPRSNLTTSLVTDAYVVDMHDGVSRKAGVRRVSVGPELATGAGVGDVSLSPDGRFVAFAARQLRPSASPAASGPIPSPGSPDCVYLVDLDADTVQAVSRSWSGDPLDGTAYAPALSAGAARIALLSNATNLFFGDGNAASDALVLSATSAPDSKPQDEPQFAPAQSLLPAAEPEAGTAVDYRLGVTTSPRPDGTVQLDAAVPGAGRLTVTVRERQLVRGSAGRRTRTGRRITTDATATSTAAGRIRLVLRPGARWAKRLRRAAGVPATVTVQFASRTGGAPLTKTRSVTFRRTAATTSTGSTR